MGLVGDEKRVEVLGCLYDKMMRVLMLVLVLDDLSDELSK